MKKISILFLIVLVFISTLQVVAKESLEEVSQFSLFMSERGLPYSEEIIPRLVNTEIDALPPSLRQAFDRFGVENLPNLIEDAPIPAGIRRPCFTGPFYVFGKVGITEKLDMDEFRKSFSSEPVLAYIIRGDEQPIGVLYVSYVDEKYEFMSLYGSTDAKNMLTELNLLSSDLSQAMDDVVFISIGHERYAFNNKDSIRASYLWTPEPITFHDLERADYAMQMELKALIEESGDGFFIGGGRASTYFYDADMHIEKYALLNSTVLSVNNAIQSVGVQNGNFTIQNNGGNSRYAFAIASGSGLLLLGAVVLYKRFRVK